MRSEFLKYLIGGEKVLSSFEKVFCFWSRMNIIYKHSNYSVLIICLFHIVEYTALYFEQISYLTHYITN